MEKVRRGKYLYKGYEITNIGYHSPDKCVWWEAVNLKTNEADFHDKTKRDLKNQIDNMLTETSDFN